MSLARSVRVIHGRLLAIAALAVAAACAGEPPTAPSSVAIDGDWVLAAGASAGRPIAIRDDARITLRVHGHEFGGTSACNQYGGTVVRSPGIRFERFQSTAIGCRPDVMALEDAYIDALRRVRDGGIVDGQLMLAGQGIELAFVPVNPVDVDAIAGRSWRLVEVVRGGITGPPLGALATASLHRDGTFVGSTGCRDLRGRYVVVGDEITMVEMSADGPDCPPVLAQQDGHVVTVIGDGFRTRVGDDGRLTMFDSPAEALVYEPDPGTR